MTTTHEIKIDTPELKGVVVVTHHHFVLTESGQIKKLIEDAK